MLTLVVWAGSLLLRLGQKSLSPTEGYPDLNPGTKSCLSSPPKRKRRSISCASLSSQHPQTRFPFPKHRPVRVPPASRSEAGLSAACELLERGCSVTILEPRKGWASRKRRKAAAEDMGRRKADGDVCSGQIETIVGLVVVRCGCGTLWLWLWLWLLLLLLLVETKTAAQHSCHMLQVRDFKGTLLGIGSKVWTSCRCGTQVLVGLFLVF